MKAERLRDAIWKIDDKFIKEAETYVPKKRSGNTIWIITSASAAVIALCTSIHYHNAVNQALRPEIDNTVAIVTTVTETELYETDVLKTEKPVQSSDTVRENTEVTETETGYESSISYAETVPEKTEAPSGNGENSGEKTALTERQNEETKVPETEPAVVTREVQTVAIETENAVTDSPSGTQMINTMITKNIVTNNSDIITQLPVSETERFDNRIYSFPVYLDDEENYYYRCKIVEVDQVGAYIQTTDFSYRNRETYTLSEYSFKDISDDLIRVMYFEKENAYVTYINDNYEPSTLGQLMKDSGMDKLSLKSYKYALSEEDNDTVSEIIYDRDCTALTLTDYFYDDYIIKLYSYPEFIDGSAEFVVTQDKIAMNFDRKYYTFTVGKEKCNIINDIIMKYQ